MGQIWSFALYVVGFSSVIGISVGLGYINVNRVRERFRISREMRLSHTNKKLMNYPLLRLYHFLLSSAFKKYELAYFTKVLLGQCSLVLVTGTIIFVVIQDLLMSFSLSVVFIFVLPIAFLYMIHKHHQSELQNDSIEGAVILLQEYHKSHLHMIYALKSVSQQMQGQSQIAYSKLFARMHDDNEMKVLATEAFAFQIGHFRGKNLANLILRACKDGMNIMTALEDMVEDLTELNKRTRSAETEARETALIGFGILPTLVILLLVNHFKLIPGGNAFYYQFQTQQGLKSFLISLIFGFIGLGLGLVIKKPKQK